MAYHLQDFNFSPKSLTDTFPIIIFAIFQFFLKPVPKSKCIFGSENCCLGKYIHFFSKFSPSCQFDLCEKTLIDLSAWPGFKFASCVIGSPAVWLDFAQHWQLWWHLAGGLQEVPFWVFTECILTLLDRFLDSIVFINCGRFMASLVIIFFI